MSHPLESTLGYVFQEPRWLSVALTHRSAAEPSDDGDSDSHNERLEFLGDAVIDLAIRSRLLATHTRASEGDLSRTRARLASRRHLAGVAEALGIDLHIRAELDIGTTHPSRRERVLASAFEAIVGAAYLDGGFECACRIAERVLETVASDPGEDDAFDSRSDLQAYWQARTGRPPRYQIDRVGGTDHSPHFRAQVHGGTFLLGQGVGPTKRAACRDAARIALDRLRSDGPWARRAESSAEEEPAAIGDGAPSAAPDVPARTGEMTRAYVGIGSNVGDRLGFLRAAVRALRERSFEISAASRVYETEPVGYRDQPWFLNAVLVAHTDSDVRAFHAALKAIEQEIGRLPTMRWGPREIDLDLLLFGSERVSDERLSVPHPRIAERRFVLVPLADVEGPECTAALGANLADLLRVCEDASDVRPAFEPTALLGG